MKRKLYFWLENLKITRNERNAVTALISLFVVLVMVKNLIPDHIPYDEGYYEELEAEFNRRTELMREKENALLARYNPDMGIQVADTDTIINDTLVDRTAGTEPISDSTISRININTADAKTLVRLPGIGPAYASRIIEYRDKNGKFTSYDELLRIKGIGKKRLEKLLPFIQLKDPIENK